MSNFKRILNRIGKIISSAIFVILIGLIILIIGYILRIKVLTDNDRLGEVRVNFYTILTQSMYPNIEAGDIVITYKNSDNVYNVGDVITFISTANASKGVTITHRVAEVSTLNGEYYYKTKGDNNPTNDSSSVKSSNVIGRVVFRIPKAGFIQQFLVTKAGWIFVILLPCLGIIIYDILKIFKLINNKAKRRIKDNKRTLEARDNLENIIGEKYEEEILESEGDVIEDLENENKTEDEEVVDNEEQL